MDQKEIDAIGREIIHDVVDVLRWKLAGVIRDSRDLENRLAQKLSYTEGGLITASTGSPSTPGHSAFRMTKTHDGADKYNLGIDASPVKTILSQEGGTHRSAVVMSETNSPNKTAFGVATSEDQGRHWNPRLVVLNNGNVGLGRKSPTQKLDVAGNIIASGTVNGRNLIADGIKLDTISTTKFDSLQYGATKNESDANLRSRATHTGTQSASTISDFNAAVSASNHATSVNNPHNVTKAQLGLEYVQNLKFNLTATNPPNALSDNSLGYSIGSCWVDTATKNWYVCVESRLGMAVWHNVSEPEVKLTAENLGQTDNAVGIFKQKADTKLQLKSLRPGSAALSITSSYDQVVLDVDSTKIQADKLIGAPSGQIVGHSDVQTITNKTISGEVNTLTKISDASLSGGISATKLSRGEVSNLEFDRLAGVTSSIQVQLNSKAAETHSHTVGEIVDFNQGVIDRVSAEKGIAGGLASLDLNGKIPASQLSIDGGVIYRGSWNATTNTPALVSGVGTKGDFYMVNVAGITNLDGIGQWQIGDSVMFDGGSWEKFGTAIQVNSVAGRQGDITLSTADILSGVFAPERISAASITQHQAAIDIQSLHRAPNSTIVGVSDLQTLSNKTISGANNTITDIGNASLLPGIDALKIGSGKVSNKRLDYLSSVTSDVQTQLNAKAFLGHQHDATDITSGQFADARIAQSNVLQHQEAMEISQLIGAPLSTVVGTSDEQILRNKTIDGHYNSISRVGNAALNSGIDAIKLSIGQVTNAHFNTLAGATSNLQTQLNAKSALGHVHTTHEIVSGTFADERISQSSVLQHQPQMSLGLMLGAPRSAICGVTDLQSITNKTISAINNTISDIGNDNLVGGIEAVKLADGSVNNFQFQQLSGVTSNIQEQLNQKAETIHGHDASEITTGVLADGRISQSSVTQHFDALNLLNAAGENVIASKLKTATGFVTISGSTAPTTGQVLMAVDDTTAEWQTAINENGTITSIGMVMPSEFSLSQATITEAGTFTISKVAQPAAMVYAGPSQDRSFGNETVGIDDTHDVGGRFLASKFSLNADMTATVMGFYVSIAVGDIRLAIYNNLNTRPAVLQAMTNSFVAVTGWNTVPLSNQVLLRSGEYWLAVMVQDNRLHFPTADSGSSCSYAIGYGQLPSNWNPTANVLGSIKLSIVVNGIAMSTPDRQPNFRPLALSDIPELKAKYLDYNSPQSLSNKTIDTTCQIVDWNDNTKRLNFDLSGSASRTILTVASQQSSNRRVTFPDMSIDDTLMTINTDQVINGGKSFRNLMSMFSGSTVYSGGLVSQNSTIITGTGTMFTSKMTGGCVVFANGAYAFITNVTSANLLVVAQPQTLVSQTYNLYYGGFQLDTGGNLSANRLVLNCQNPLSRGLVVRSHVDQTANLTEWHSGNSNPQAVINSSGNFDTSSYANGYLINGKIVLQMPNGTSVLIGYTANSSGSTLGVNNTVCGVNGGKLVTTSHNNTLYGFNAGSFLTTTELANYSTMIGSNAGYRTTGDSNTFYGESAGASFTTGSFNLCLGRNSANDPQNLLYTGNFNTTLGASSHLLKATTEKASVFGYGASAGSGGVSVGWTSIAEANELAIRAGNGVYLLKASATTLTLPSPTSTLTLGTNVINFPQISDTLVGLTSTQTLTNKTLINPVISSINNAGAAVTLPTSTDTLIGRSTTDLLRNKSIVFGSIEYSVGTASQNSTSLVGINTIFTNAMVGGLVVFADGTQAFITAFVSSSILTVTPPQSVLSQTYMIYYGGLQIDKRGNVNFKPQQPPSGSHYQSATLNPAGTISTEGVMMGLKSLITPISDGRLMIIVTGSIKNSANNRGARVQIRYGTGTAPNNGDALIGVLAGTPVEMLNANNTPTCPITLSAMVTGMDVGVTYWVDVSLAAIVGGTATLSSFGITASE